MRTRGGLNIPVRGEVCWIMPDGQQLTYGDFNIVSVAYNRADDRV